MGYLQYIRLMPLRETANSEFLIVEVRIALLSRPSPSVKSDLPAKCRLGPHSDAPAFVGPTR